MNLIEILGWVATVIVVSSFYFKDINKLRAVNFVGCLMFVIYGFLIWNPPIIITNVSVILIHLNSYIRENDKKSN